MSILQDQVRALRTPDVKIAFGFLLDMICLGDEPGYGNARKLFPAVWERASVEVRKLAGFRYHKLSIEREEQGQERDSKTRLLEVLIEVEGVELIPDAARAPIYRQAAKKLAAAKDTSYGWGAEQAAARTLLQLGTKVPSIAFEEVYQEVLAVWCGNYWGRSSAHGVLARFIDDLGTPQLRRVVQLFQSNERVREELDQAKPKICAKQLLKDLRERFTIEAHKAEVDEVVQAL